MGTSLRSLMMWHMHARCWRGARVGVGGVLGGWGGKGVLGACVGVVCVVGGGAWCMRKKGAGDRVHAEKGCRVQGTSLITLRMCSMHTFCW
jgi:hypothetical protein